MYGTGIISLSIPDFMGHSPAFQIPESMVLEGELHPTFMHDILECQPVELANTGTVAKIIDITEYFRP